MLSACIRVWLIAEQYFIADLFVHTDNFVERDWIMGWFKALFETRTRLRWVCLSAAMSLLVILTSSSFCASHSSGYSCYISEQGDGGQNGTSLSDAYAWSNGEGLKTCLAGVEAGDTIYLAYADNYQLTEPIWWDKSGTPDQPITLKGAGDPAVGGEFGQSVLTARDQWPIITGTRSPTESGQGGTDFLRFGPDVSYVTVQNLNLNRFNSVFTAGDSDEQFRNSHMTVSDISVEYAREVVSVFGDDDNSGAESWDVSRIYALGVSKRMVRSEGMQNSVFSDLYVDTKSPQGEIFWDDWPLLFHFSGPSQNIEVTRAIAKNPGQREDNYDNGDCFSTESDTSYITFQSVRCFDAFDAALDLKGHHHVVENAIAFRIGNRAFRVWQGPVTIRNAIAGFDGQGEHTQEARGSNAALWVRGDADVEHFTSINNTRPYLIEGGHIKISDSIIALDRHYADRSLDAEYEEPGEVEETDTVMRWIEDQTGRDPEFHNASNLNWNGDGADFDSQYYRGQIGFQNVE